MYEVGFLALFAAWCLAFSAARSNRLADARYYAFDQRRLDELGQRRLREDPWLPTIFATAVSYMNYEARRRLLKDTTGRYLFDVPPLHPARLPHEESPR